MDLSHTGSTAVIRRTPTRNAKKRSVCVSSRKKSDKFSSPKTDPVTSPSSLITILLEQIPDVDKYFNVHKKVGEGTFSCVFMATSKILPSEKSFAIKHLYPTSHPSRILQELKCLRDIGGSDNVVGVDLCFRNRDSVAFIMPFFSHDSFSDYVLDMSVEETKLYMKNLMIALKRVHSFNMVHRDIKPNNFLYNRKERKFLLVDFGLSHFVETTGIQDKKRKRATDTMDKLISSEKKRPALNSLSTNVRELRNSGKKSSNSKSATKTKSPLYKENSPMSIKKKTGQRDIRHVKRNLQFGNLADIKNESLAAVSSPVFLTKTSSSIANMKFHSYTPELTRFRMSMNKEGSSFFRLQNSQVKSRYSISGSYRSSLQSVPVNSPYQINRCGCDGKPRICNGCILRRAMNAPRAGTPGYRSPEVLLRYPQQTTAIDIWSAGVIMISIMSGSYPFFRAPDDTAALMEIITVFGTETVVNTARRLGRSVLTNETYKPLNLRKLCERLRQRSKEEKRVGDSPKMIKCPSCQCTNISQKGCLCSDYLPSQPEYPESAYDLLAKLLSIDPKDRFTAEQALEHPFLND